MPSLLFDENDDHISLLYTINFHFTVGSLHTHRHGLLGDFSVDEDADHLLAIFILDNRPARNRKDVHALPGNDLAVSCHSHAKFIAWKGKVEFYAILGNAVAVGGGFINLTHAKGIVDSGERIELNGAGLADHDERNIDFGDVDLDAIGRCPEHGDGRPCGQN